MLQNAIKENNVLCQAFKNNEFLLHYQPIVDAATHETMWVEALMRWHSPKFGEVTPDKFIPIMEKEKLIIPIGTWVLEKACRQLKKWHEIGYTNFGVSVNVSSVQLQHYDFAKVVQCTLFENGVNPKNILLEITESSKLNADTNVINTLKILREMGVRISIDDFGTGYNCMKYLHEFECTSLKIDKFFVKNLENDRGKILIDSIISLGHRMGLKIIAEGIETIKQCEQLKSMGCDMLQGYNLCKPASPERLLLFLENKQNESHTNNIK